MKISRPRLVLRAALLLVGGGYMLVKSLAMGRAGLAAAAGDRRLLLASSAVAALMGVLALVAAGMAVLALRPRPRQHTLHLEGLRPERGSPPDGAPDQ